ncbi:MAG: hypothetical protein KGQ93_11935 [Cyanobacteria bacterium REEB459]|nr:hypothetical protein [Cyanobacteria bacterium REEB459]
MSSPELHAFFIGRALAEALNDRAQHVLTDTLSWLGKVDAEQREQLRQFTEEVIAWAQQTESGMGVQRPAPSTDGEDLQATIDTLRAEIAQVRVALQQYRSGTAGDV